MLFLGHFVVVNWSEQLAVMQVMELLFCFHLRGLCVCACVCMRAGREGKQGPAKCGERDGSWNEGSITDWKGPVLPGLFSQHLLAPFTVAAVKHGVSVWSRMLTQTRGGRAHSLERRCNRPVLHRSRKNDLTDQVWAKLLLM